MAYSITTYTADGTPSPFPIPFNYISTDHVKVLVNGTIQTSVSIQTPGMVSVSPTPPAGASVEVYRETPADVPLVVYKDGAVLPASQDNLAIQQLLNVAQEARDAAARIPSFQQVVGDIGTIPFKATGGTLLDTVANRAARDFNVRDYGAVGDGVTDDSAAFTRAILAAYTSGGGTVRVPPSGNSYVIATGLTLLSNVSLVADRSPHWFGSTQPWQQWTKRGACLQPTDMVNPAITVSGAGCSVVGINFVHAQPTPSSTPGVAFTPTTYPWCIRVTQNFVRLEDIHIVNATHGIAWDYTSSSGGGTYCYMRDIFSGALVTSVWFHNVNDTMRVTNFRDRALWYCSNSNVVDFMEANKVGWHMEYLDNLQGTDIEFFQCWKAIRGTNGTVNAGAFNLTHACVLVQLTNLSFNLCVQAIDLDTPNTLFSGTLVNVIVQSETVTGRAAGYFFNLASDNADLTMVGVTCPEVGHSFMAVGGGIAGRACIVNPRIDRYGTLGGSSPAFYLGAGAFLDIPTGTQGITRLYGAGPVIAGVGAATATHVHSNVYADREGGTVALIASAPGDDTSGYLALYGTAGDRRGYVGNSSPTAKEVTLASDHGSVNITSVGCRLYVQSDGQIVFADANGNKKGRFDCGTGSLVIAGTLTQNGTP